MNKNITISTKTVVVTLGLLGVSAILYQVFDIIVQLVIALIFTLSVEPAIQAMHKRKVPRGLAVGFVFSLAVLLIALFITVALPLVVSQVKKLIIMLPSLVNGIGFLPDIRTLVNGSLSQLTAASGSVFSVTFSLFSNALTVLTVFIFSLYLSFDLPNVKRRFLSLFSDDMVTLAAETIDAVELNLSRWVVGQLFLMLVIGVASYIGLAALGVPYALPIAIIAGFLEIIPVLGPIISTIVAGVVGFAINPNIGILVVILFFGIQQLENNLLVPKIMQRVVGFSPLITMVALLVGGKLLGVVGALIAIPVALISVVIFKKLVALDLD